MTNYTVITILFIPPLAELLVDPSFDIVQLLHGGLVHHVRVGDELVVVCPEMLVP